MLAQGLVTEAEHLLTQYLGQTVTMGNVSVVSGGSINSSYVLNTSLGSYFLKYNNASRYPKMFQLEAEALRLIASTQTIRVPQVIGTGSYKQDTFLILEYLQQARPKPNYWYRFAEQLGAMHQSTSVNYGLEHDNYMGSLQQINTPESDWVSFFKDKRLQVQINLAQRASRLSTTDVHNFDLLFNKLDDLLFDETPALVHGDLWSGNFMTGPNGWACIYDPALYYGHREVDIAMTQLFGGFDTRFYDAYQQLYPLAPGYQQRLDIYNLYPLLIHLNLFGSGYLSGIKSTLKQFV